MPRLFGLLALALLCAPPLLSAEEELSKRVSADLRRFYAERLRRPFFRAPDDPEEKVGPPPWSAPLKQLAAAKSSDRQQAVAYLRELLSQSLEHERSGKAPWRNTSYWGGKAEVPARDLRKEVATELAETGLLPDALPVLRWYVEKEPIDPFLEPIMKALGKLDGKEVDALRAELAGWPHPNVVVAASALEQIRAHKGPLPDDRLSALCHHHRSEIRKAARNLNAARKGKDPGPFDGARALRSEAVRKVMDETVALLVELPSAKARFVTVHIRYLDDKKTVRGTWEAKGWLIREKRDLVELYMPYGRSETFQKGEKERRDRGGWTISRVETTVDFSIEPGKLEELVGEVEKSRAEGQAQFELSPGGALTGQFRGSGATLYEAVLGAWLYRAGRDAEAARIVLPALDSMYSDRHLPKMVRQQLGEIYGYRMLVAFAGDRDYPGALRWAKFINEQCPGTRFHDYAKRLAEQLPRRMDDFTKFKLPTPVEWEGLKKKLTRTQQIDYLCERMRLLQYGPASIGFSIAPQYAEPCGMDADASRSLEKGKTRVINPRIELDPEFSGVGGDKPGPGNLELTLADVPQLSKHLRDDWFTLGILYWRAFHPDRTLRSTREELAEIINALAQKDVCKIGEWEGRTPAEIDREIERISRWAKENAHKTPVQLEWDALDEEAASGASWYAIRNRVESLLQQKETRVYDVMKRYLESDKTDASSKSLILASYLEHDVSRAAGLARKYLDAKDSSLRRQAGLIVFRTGGKDRTRPILSDGLAKGAINGWVANAVKALLEDGSPESVRQVKRLFTNKDLAHDRFGIRPAVFRLCVKAGMKEPYQFYLPLLDNKSQQLPHLDDKGKPTGVSVFHPTVAEEFAREIVERFAGDEPAVQEIVKKFPKTADQIPHLKKWLRSRAEETKD
jgi:hypothetical protein